MHIQNVGREKGANLEKVIKECEDLDQKVDSLVEKGIVFEEMPTDKPWLWREAKLKDPDGNQLILFFSGENRLNPPWRIKDV